MHFPTGFIGDPHNVPACSLTEFSLHACSPDSQVGVAEVLGTLRQAAVQPGAPCRPGGPGRLLRPGAETPLFIVLHARTGSDYGLDATSSPIYHCCRSPTIAVHSGACPRTRATTTNASRLGTTEGVECKPYPGGCFGPVKSTSPPAPYLQNPTTCGVPLTASHSIEYYSGSRQAEDDWPATTGCDQLTFNPSLTATPTTEAADSTSGLDVTLKVPQTQSPTAPSPSEIRSVDDDASRTGSRWRPTAPTARSPAPTRNSRSTHGGSGALSRVRQDRHLDASTARRCPARSRAASTSASPCPGRPTASSSPPTASPPT